MFLARGGVPPMLLYVGNVEAARAGERTLAHQRDFNRAWNGGEAPEAQLARQVTHHAMEARPRLAIDLHNNTGTNPHYSVLTDLHPRCLGAALEFSPLALLAQHRDGIQTERFAEFCPRSPWRPASWATRKARSGGRPTCGRPRDGARSRKRPSPS